MRFCYLVDETVLARSHGGIAVRVHRMAQLLTVEGHECVVVGRTGQHDAVVEFDGIRYHLLAVRHLPQAVPGRIRKRFDPPLGLLDFANRAAAQVRVLEDTRPFDLVVAASTNAPSLFTGKLRSPVVVEFSSKASLSEVNHLEQPMRTVKAWSERKVVSQASACITNSAALSPTFAQQFPRARVLYLPKPLPEVRPDVSLPPIPRVPPDYLLFAAKSLSPTKGAEILAEAFPRVLSEVPGLSLVFVASDRKRDGRSVRSRIRDLAGPAAAKRISFFDFLEQPVLQALMRGARAVVIPSLSEALPNVALEAVGVGQRLVVTAGNGMEDVVDEGGNGSIVAAGDPMALAEGLIRCLRLDDAEVSSANQKLLGRHKPSAVAERLVEIAIDVARSDHSL